jgi:hypothetical protein
MRTALLLVLSLPVLAACASTNADGVNGGEDFTRSRAVSDSYVAVFDQSPREPVAPSDVVVLSAVGGIRPLPGCTLVSRLYLETTSPAQAQSAAVTTAARMGAPVVIMEVAAQETAHDAASKRALSASTISTRYQVDAVDCR